MSDSSDSSDDERLAQLQNELANVPFEKLLEIKQQMGEKEFRKIQAKKPERKEFKPTKRADKNAPAELSAKKQVSRKRQVVDVKKRVIRDPRFEPTSGEFNSDLFKRSYGFIEELQHKELAELQHKISKTRNVEERASLEKLHQKISSRIETEAKKSKVAEIKRKWKKSEQAKIKEGKSHSFSRIVGFCS